MAFSLFDTLTAHDEKQIAEEEKLASRKVKRQKTLEQLRGQLFCRISEVANELNSKKQKQSWIKVFGGGLSECSLDLTYRGRTVTLFLTDTKIDVTCNGKPTDWQLELREVEETNPTQTESQYGLFAVDSQGNATRLTTGWRTETLDWFLAKILIPSQIDQTG